VSRSGEQSKSSAALATGPIAQPAGATPVGDTELTAVIQYGGRRFECKPEMARIFLKRARAVIECGEHELVPLLHSEGVELLLISRATPYSLLEN
jgi:hypothetical protein